MAVQTEALIVLLFTIAVVVAIVVRRLNLPYTVALVVTGTILGILRLFTPIYLTKELLFTIFLPGLLFEAAFHTEFREFWRNRWVVITLAVPGVMIAILITTLLLTPVVTTLHLEQGFTWQFALLFGAAIAATDPIAVLAVLRSLGAPSRLSILLGGESVLNDGTAIVFFTLALAMVNGTSVTAGRLAVDFFTIVGLGALVGGVAGVIVSQLIIVIDDIMIETTLTTIAAYGSFAAAEYFGGSGVIAVVVAGVVCGNYGRRRGMSPSTRVAVENFWEYLAFALNSIVFLLIGLEVDIQNLLSSWLIILIAFIIVTMSRAVVVLLVTAMLHKKREAIPFSWSLILTWGGL
ncbi:MAG: cation:proton antiporter, partial [Anaerolineae bacterium]